VADARQNFVVPFVLQLAVILALPGLSRREESNQFLGDYGVIYQANLHKLFVLVDLHPPGTSLLMATFMGFSGQLTALHAGELMGGALFTFGPATLQGL
jgi:hypothetical protein